MFVALGLDKSEYWKDRISVFIATAPVMMPNRQSKLFKYASKIERYGEQIIHKLGIAELFGYDWSKIQPTVRTILPWLTDEVLASFSLKEFIDPECALIFKGHFPHGTGIRQITHYGQLVNSNNL